VAVTRRRPAEVELQQNSAAIEIAAQHLQLPYSVVPSRLAAVLSPNRDRLGGELAVYAFVLLHVNGQDLKPVPLQ
jgi:hypothetical protein